jgi:hypothetical protein
VAYYVVTQVEKSVDAELLKIQTSHKKCPHGYPTQEDDPAPYRIASDGRIEVCLDCASKILEVNRK